jgi:uncharacterized 2Fe-2S/4Fe-4S cluster protein (DUF4445 family)
MSELIVVFGEETHSFQADDGELMGDVIARTDLTLEQPCAGRGTCGRCKVLVEVGANPPDEIEIEHLTPGEISVGTRLACRARISGKTQVVLSPVMIYSNKAFKSSDRYKRDRDVDLGLAIDLGSTTAAAFLVMLDNGEMALGGAALNQQRVYGADVISRLHAALRDTTNAERLRKLALSSINQSINALLLSPRILKRVKRVSIVGNVAMHHLLLNLPVKTIATLPFQPYKKEALRMTGSDFHGLVSDDVEVLLPPMIGGFVGSDALACLAAFDFEEASSPMLAIDLGTNGEVLLTDGSRTVAASTAAGPAFEGVNITCGMRAVDGAIVSAEIYDGGLRYETIGAEPPVGITGSGLLSLVYQLRNLGIVATNGRLVDTPELFSGNLQLLETNRKKRISLTDDGTVSLSQLDVRELQKAKGAIRAAVEVLMNELDLKSSDLHKVILTGSFGGEVDVESAIELGMIPRVEPSIVESISNGAGVGAAIFLSDEGFARAKHIAASVEQIDLDRSRDFERVFIDALTLE